MTVANHSDVDWFVSLEKLIIDHADIYSSSFAFNLSKLRGHRAWVGLANIDVGIASRIVVFDDQNEVFSWNDLRDPDFVYFIIFSCVSPWGDEP